MRATEAPPSPWLVGPTADLLLGCGVLYMVLFVAFGMAGPELRSLTPVSLPILLALVLSAPHYGATLLRVYENRADRSRYFLFAVHATLAVCTLYVIGLHSTAVASWLLTIFLVWSPWHYSGQNYGLAVMFIRRRGVPLPPSVKRLLHASFILSYVLLVLVLFTGDAPDSEVARSYGAAGREKIRLQSLGIPSQMRTLGAPVALAYVLVTIAAAVGLLRRARVRDLVPTGLLVVTQAPVCEAESLVSVGQLRVDVDGPLAGRDRRICPS